MEASRGSAKENRQQKRGHGRAEPGPGKHPRDDPQQGKRRHGTGTCEGLDERLRVYTEGKSRGEVRGVPGNAPLRIGST